MSASVRRALGLVAALALSAVVVVGCGGDSNPNGSNNGGGDDPIGSGDMDSRMVGSWVIVYDPVRNNRHSLITYNTSGYYDLISFRKRADFWIESTDPEYKQWRTENGKFYYRGKYEGAEWRLAGPYTISGGGNTLTLIETECEEEYVDGEWVETDICEEYITTMTKTNLTSFKNSLGTIRTQDLALRGDWTISEGGTLEFYSSFHEYPSRYMSTSYDYEVYYTNGNRLFLLGVNCDEWGQEECESSSIAETVELTYSITGPAGSRTLTLTNSSKGINDVWTEQVYDDYYSPAKRRAGSAKRANNMFNAPFTSAR